MTSPFARVARTHAASAAGDALIAVALAGSLFFSIDPAAARWRVGLYLLLTVAPFGVVAPLVGPVMDRAEGGRRWMIVGTCVGRLIVAGFMIRDLDSLLLFPEAFAMLVLGKGYHVAKSAVVPSTVRHENELVQANSKLQIVSALAGLVAGAPALLLNRFAGPSWSVALAAVVFGLATVLATRIPATTVASKPAGAAELATLRSLGIRLASWAMGLMRGVVGFLTFLLAFVYRSTTDGGTDYRLGVVLAASVAGALGGAVLAPRIRRLVSEEHMLVGALALTVLLGLVAAFAGGLVGGSLIAFTVGITAAAGKLAFDAIVQRDAPHANQGRSFAKFESRFQLMWVLGAIVPVALPIPAQVGFLIIVAAAAGGLVWYLVGTHKMSSAHDIDLDLTASSADSRTSVDNAASSAALTVADWPDPEPRAELSQGEQVEPPRDTGPGSEAGPGVFDHALHPPPSSPSELADGSSTVARRVRRGARREPSASDVLPEVSGPGRGGDPLDETQLHPIVPSDDEPRPRRK